MATQNTTELPGSLSAALGAAGAAIGTFPGTTGDGCYADAGAAGTFYAGGPYANGDYLSPNGKPATPYKGLDLASRNECSIDIQGTFVGTVSLDRSFDGGQTWKSVKTYTQAAEDTYEAPEGCLLRLSMPTWTSGTANVRLGKGR